MSRDNLFAYLALCGRDLREVQLELTEEGLSSLGRLEQLPAAGDRADRARPGQISSHHKLLKMPRASVTMAATKG